MNRIYKVIWSKVKHQYVVVSELTRSNTKSASRSIGKSLAAALAVLTLTTGVGVIPVWAAEPVVDENSNVTIGADTTVNVEDGSEVNIGGNWQGTGTSSLDMDTSNLDMTNTTIHFNTDGKGNLSIFQNTDSTFSSTGAAENNTVIGENGYFYKSSNNKVIGDNAYIGGSSNILAIGDNLNVKDLDKDGNFSSADSSNSLIYGNNNSLESSKNTIVVGNGNTVAGYTLDGYNGQNVLIGNDIYLGKKGNNAIKAEEVVAIGSDISISNGAIGAILVGDGANLTSAGSDSVTIGHDASGAANAVAIGANTAVQESNIAIGNGAIARGNENPSRPGTYYGAGNAIAIGENAMATSGEAIAMGFNTHADSSGVAMGRDVTIGKSSSYATAIGGWNHIGDNSDYSVAIGGGPAGQDGARDNGASIGDNSGYSVAIGTYSLIGDNVGQSVAMGYNSNIGNGTGWSVVIGPSAVLGENVKQSAAYGYGATVNDDSTYSNAIGVKASIGSNTEEGIVAVDYGNAIGSYASVMGDYGTALGNSASANSEWATALGSSSDANLQGTAVGANAQALAANSVAIGVNSEVSEGADYSVALGTASGVTADDLFTTEDLEAFKTAVGTDYNDSWNISAADTTGVISVGKSGEDGFTRRITNVSKGRISADSTDAINGSQLRDYAVSSATTNEETGTVTLTMHDRYGIGEDYTVDFTGVGKSSWNLKVGDVSTPVESGDTVLFQTNTNDKGASNLYITKDGLDVTVGMKDEITLTGVTADRISVGPVSINKDTGIDAGGLNINSVKDGEISADSQQAVNGSQLYQVEQHHTTVTEGKNIDIVQMTGDKGQQNYEVSLEDDVHLGNKEAGAFVDVEGTKGTITVGTLGTQVTVNGQMGTINGLTNKTWDPTAYVSGQAATEDQLKAVDDKVGAAVTEAGKHTTVTNGDDNVKVEGKEQADGHMEYEVSLNDKVTLGEGTNQIFLNGEAGTANVGSIFIDGKNGTINNLTNLTWNPDNYVSGQAATEDQLHQAISSVETNFQQNDQHLVANPGTQDGHYFVDGKNQVNLQVQNGIDENNKPKYDTVTIDNVAQASDVGNVNDFHDDVKNEDGSHTTVVDAINNIDTRVDQVEIDIDNLGDRIDGVEATAGKHSSVSNTDGNITVDGTGKNEAGGVDYVVGLNNDKITVGNETNNVTIEGTKGSITVTNSVSAGQTTISNEGVSVGDNTYITDKGINANNQVITNVAAGSADTDAVNVSQLKGVEQRVENNSMAITNIGNKVDKLDNRIDEVGAGAAALAALHPLDFDPDDKWDFAAGYGNYRGENAVAIGAFYRPNEDTMFSVGGTVGNGDNMINAGVSFKLGQGNGVSTSRVAMAKEIKSMRDIVAKQDAQIQKLTAMVNALVGMEAIAPDTTTMFPDVPENHWAYEAVETMAKTGLVQGYPDGEFKGDRNMTRYEFAQIVYNAIQAGIKVDERLVQEFRPELEYFRIDTISKDRDGNPVIQRVRANEVPATK